MVGQTFNSKNNRINRLLLTNSNRRTTTALAIAKVDHAVTANATKTKTTTAETAIAMTAQKAATRRQRGENDDDGRDDGRAQRSEQKNGENEENGGCEIRDERDYCSGYFLDDATQNRCRNNRTRHQCWTRTSLIKVKTNVETANNQSRVS